MRSETSKRILSETSEETKQKVRETANKLVMDKYKELATALVVKYYNNGFVNCMGDLWISSKQCAKFDLQHSIELLEEVREDNQLFTIQMSTKIQSLRNQLEHLNSI